MVWWRCTRKGCSYRRREHSANLYVAHTVRGEEHPMKKEETK